MTATRISEDDVRRIVDGLINTIDNPSGERPVQRYLEQHPALVCAGRTPIVNDSIISQLPLGADFVCDFAFVTQLSRGTILHLIEIERPELKIFTEHDDFSQPYNHAFQQLQDWAHWCAMNQQYLSSTLYSLLQSGQSNGHIITACTLIAGRRGEINSQRRSERFSAKDTQLPKGLSIMTFDRFIESLPYLQLTDALTRIRCSAYKKRGFMDKA